MTAAYREGGPRLAVYEGCSYLLPTIVLCDSPEHPLANREFLFPYASVVPVRQEEIPRALGSEPGGHGDHARPRSSSRGCSPRPTWAG